MTRNTFDALYPIDNTTVDGSRVPPMMAGDVVDSLSLRLVSTITVAPADVIDGVTVSIGFGNDPTATPGAGAPGTVATINVMAKPYIVDVAAGANKSLLVIDAAIPIRHEVEPHARYLLLAVSGLASADWDGYAAVKAFRGASE